MEEKYIPEYYFNEILSKLINSQVDLKQPIYVIANYWLGKFTGINGWFTTEGDKELDKAKEYFRKNFAWTDASFGVTEMSRKLIRIDITEVLDSHGEEIKGNEENKN